MRPMSVRGRSRFFLFALFLGVSGCTYHKAVRLPSNADLLPPVTTTDNWDEERKAAREEALDALKEADQLEAKTSAKASREKPIALPIEHLTPSRENGGEEETIVDSSEETLSFYYAGLQSMKARQYEQAAGYFSQFIRWSPEHAYADRAQYWIAKAHLENQEYSLASLAAQRVQQRFPSSPKVVDSLRIREAALRSEGHSDLAETVKLERLKTFPESDGVRLRVRTP